MPKYITEMDEAKIVQKLLLTKGGDYFLFSLLKESNVRVRPIGFIHEVPAIHIFKVGGTEENVLGDAMSSGRGNFQISNIAISVITRRKVSKTYNGVVYEGVELCKKIRDIVKQVMFENHRFYDGDYPDVEFVLESMSSDLEAGGIQNYGAISTSELRYSITSEIKRG